MLNAFGEIAPGCTNNTMTLVDEGDERDAWHNIGGTKHDQFEHVDRPGALIVVPRHREQSPGVARSIAKVASWK